MCHLFNLLISILSTHSDCECQTCILAGGPCFSKLMKNAKQNYCVKCTVFERIDRDYLDCVTEFMNSKTDEANQTVRLVYQPKDVEQLQLEVDAKSAAAAQQCIVDKDETAEWSRDHGYHLSWAVFKHLPCK